jgi:hypothetical protein
MDEKYVRVKLQNYYTKHDKTVGRTTQSAFITCHRLVYLGAENTSSLRLVAPFHILKVTVF